MEEVSPEPSTQSLPPDPPSDPQVEDPVPSPPAHSIAIQGQIEVISPPDSPKASLYLVKVPPIQGEDAAGPFEVTRKSSDFAVLRAVLVLHWPGVMLPPLPGGRNFAEFMERSDNDDRNESNRLQFQSFLQRLMQIPYIFNTEPVEKFLHSSNDYEKSIAHLKEVSFIEICNKYMHHFLQYMQEPDPEQPIVLEHYSQVFKEAVTKLRNFRKVGKSMKSYFDSMMETSERLAECFETYEVDCVSEFGKRGEGNYRPVFKRVRGDGYQNPYTVIVKWAKTEEQEFQAMLDVLEIRSKLAEEKSKFESKVRSESSDLTRMQAGKLVLGSLLTLRSRNEVQSELEVELKWVLGS